MADTPFTDTIELNDFPKWSGWPARLLGLEEWSTTPRTKEKIEREYGRDKYGSCLTYLEEHPTATAEDLRTFEYGGEMEREVCVSIGESLYRTRLKEAHQYQSEAVLARLEPYLADADAVCELGSGYGYYLWLIRNQFPDKRSYGCDVVENARVLGEKLYTNGSIVIEQKDLMDPNLHLPFAKDDRVLIFTFFAYHQLPSAQSALERLKAIKGDRWSVCHFEPIFEWCSDSALGLLRRAYTQANDYNRDMLTALQGIPGVQIEKAERELFGFNPLHPVSFVQWR